MKGFKPNTQRTYLIEVGNLARYFDKSPEELGKEEVKEYLLHLMNDKKLSQGTFKSYVSGIKFLYKTTLNRHEVVDDIKVPSSKNFFIHVEVLSKLFKYKFLDYLKSCFETGALIFPGGISHLVEPRAFERLRSAFYYKSGLSIASRLSAVTKESFNTWADILTGSPSAITSSWRFRMARSHFAGVITPMVISKRS